MNMESEYLFGDDGACPLCTKTFTRRASLLNHIRNHSAERKYVCSYCQKGKQFFCLFEFSVTRFN